MGIPVHAAISNFYMKCLTKYDIFSIATQAFHRWYAYQSNKYQNNTSASLYTSTVNQYHKGMLFF